MLKFTDIRTAFEHVSSGSYGECEAWLSQEKSKVFMKFDEMITGEKPEVTAKELKNGDWIAIPDKRDLNLGKKLVFRFAEKHLPECDCFEVERMFSKRGAYAQWRYFLERHDLLQKWYDYSDQAEIRVLKSWLNLEQITYEDTDGSIVAPSESGEDDEKNGE